MQKKSTSELIALMNRTARKWSSLHQPPVYKFDESSAAPYLKILDRWMNDEISAHNASIIEGVAALLVPILPLTKEERLARSRASRNRTRARIRSYIRHKQHLADSLAKDTTSGRFRRLAEGDDTAEKWRVLLNATLLVQKQAEKDAEAARHQLRTLHRASHWRDIYYPATILFVELNQTDLIAERQAETVLALFELFEFDWGGAKGRLGRIRKLRVDALESPQGEHWLDMRRRRKFGRGWMNHLYNITEQRKEAR